MGYQMTLSQELDMAQAWASTFPNTPNAATEFIDYLNSIPIPPGGLSEEIIIITHPKN